MSWQLKLAQREAKLKNDQQRLEEDQQILNAGRKELADHAEELRLGELRMAWLREEVVRIEKQVDEAKKRRLLLENDLRILDKRLEQERHRLMDVRKAVLLCTPRRGGTPSMASCWPTLEMTRGRKNPAEHLRHKKRQTGRQSS